MKKNFIIYTLIIFILTSFTIFAEREAKLEELRYKEETDLIYFNDEKEPFTGIAKDYYDDNSLRVEYPHKNGKPEGLAKGYYPSGKLKSEANFVDGLLNGKSMTYYENGNVEYEENYKDDELDGLIKNYYENGKLKIVVNYKNGELDGLAKEYYENGQLHIEENYKDGKLEGESTNYDENGNLTSKAIYKDDEMVENLFGDTEEDTSSKNNKLKGYTGPIILCGLIGLYVFLTAYKMLKSFPKTSHLTDEQRSRIFKILMKYDEGNKELFSSYTLNGVGSSYYRVASMMVDNEKVYIYAKMLSFVYLPTPITFGYLFGYSKDHILASYSNATFKEVKKEIEDTVLHI
ncbi:MAG: toxin-antitoxin system YwqK family antitoxin [Fusobacterium periodonticum]|nr:toxin-antitoxin system YwqK family antitoxin [Fusobacterium periodonticum]